MEVQGLASLLFQNMLNRMSSSHRPYSHSCQCPGRLGTTGKPPSGKALTTRHAELMPARRM